MDVLSDVLRNLPVRGGLTGELEVGSPWGIRIPVLDDAKFHIVSRGGCYLHHAGETLSLASGDVVLFPHGSAHSLVDHPSTVPQDFDVFVRNAQKSGDSRRGSRFFLGGGDGARTTIICGKFHFDGVGDHLLGVLPERILVRSQDDPRFGWLDQSLRFIVGEAQGNEPGAQIAIDRLVDLLFVQTVRSWLRGQSSCGPGWIGALSDPKIAEALSILHDAPEHAWTVDTLGRAVGMSRSGFAARFTRLIGKPPLRYLMGWRMTLAAQRLRADASATVGEIARSVGYESEAAFSEVFKRHFQAPPASWRRNQAQVRSQTFRTLPFATSAS